MSGALKAVSYTHLAEADAMTESPHSNQMFQLPARGSHPRRCDIGVVEDGNPQVHAPARKSVRQHLAELGAFGLLQIGRFFDYARADDARKADTHRGGRGVMLDAQVQNGLGDGLRDRLHGHAVDSVGRCGIVSIVARGRIETQFPQ